jgi:hypothetical protein
MGTIDASANNMNIPDKSVVGLGLYVGEATALGWGNGGI